MTVLKCEDIMCKNCTARIEKALTAHDFDFSVSLKDKTVTINASDAEVINAIEILDDLGFEAIKI